MFTPLTRLCRDACGYCTFAQPPVPGRRSYMTMEEVLQVASLGAQQGCAEILFTLGAVLLAGTHPNCIASIDNFASCALQCADSASSLGGCVGGQPGERGQSR